MGILFKTIVTVNVLLFVFSAVIAGFSAATIANFDRSIDTFFTRADFGWFLFAGMVGMIISVLACLGASNPLEHYNLLFCYFVMLSLIILMLSFGFYLYRIFVNNLEIAADGAIESAVRVESAKEFNDFLLSVYIACCTGCVQAIQADCVNDLPVAETSEGYCDPGRLGLSGNETENDECLIPKICNLGNLNVNQGLNQGCFINAKVIPPYEIFNNVCVFFDEFATTQDDIAIVGPVTEKGCGEGDPRVFVEDVFSFMSKNRALIIFAWVMGIMITSLAWLGSLSILTCPARYEAGKAQMV